MKRLFSKIEGKGLPPARGLRPAKGYTLIEMALALSVLALLLAGTLVPVQSLMQEERIDRAEKELDDVYNAVVGFALRARTAPRVLAAAISPNNTGDIYLGGGRPYFPCPDINGDGLEDRVLGSQQLTITMALATPGSATQAPVVPGPGSCVSQKGVLPWRTVGTKPRDPWGNYYTYHVDIAFSNSVLGFDQNSRADIFDPRRINGGSYVRRNAGVTGGRGDYVMPMQVCAWMCGHGSSTPNAAGRGYFLSTDIWRIENVTVAAARPYITFEAIDGPVFVLLSHGPNGSGAINGWQDAVAVGGDLRCNAPPPVGASPGNYNRAEADNASYFADDFPCDNAAPALAPMIGFSNRYVYSVYGGGLATLEEYDDILRWLSADALFAQLARNGFFNTVKKDDWHLE